MNISKNIKLSNILKEVSNENESKLTKMKFSEIESLQKEIFDVLSPNVITMLKNRGKKILIIIMKIIIKMLKII